jgi:hypothetical protein
MKALAWLTLLLGICTLATAGGTFVAEAFGGGSQAFSADAAMQQTCLSWATLVRVETQRGISAERIDREGDMLSLESLRLVGGYNRTIPELCGSAELVSRARDTDEPLPVLRPITTSATSPFATTP